jgi:hypothetical protein
MKLPFPFVSVGLLVIFSTYCVREIKLDTDQLPAVPVINCLFTPDSTWTVYVARTQLLDDPSEPWVSDASVVIYADNQVVETLTLSAPGKYVGQKRPLIGVDYTLKVKIPTFSEVTSTDAIPYPVQLERAKTKFKQSSEAHCDPACTAMEVQFSDSLDFENRYEIEVYRYFKKGGNDTLFLQYILGYGPNGGSGYGVSTDEVILAEGDLEYNPTTVFFSDDLIDGKKSAIINFDLSGLAPSTGLEAVVRLRSVSNDYYLFRKSWTRHANRQWINPNGSGAPADFFYTPPLELMTNIKGGLGIFAGFCSDTIVTTQ